MPHIALAGDELGVVAADGGGDELQAQRRERVAVGVGLPGQLQRIPDCPQAAGVLGAVVADQHGGVGQDGGEEAADVGDAGAGVEHDVAEAAAGSAGKPVDQLAEKLDAQAGFGGQESVAS